MVSRAVVASAEAERWAGPCARRSMHGHEGIRKARIRAPRSPDADLHVTVSHATVSPSRGHHGFGNHAFTVHGRGRHGFAHSSRLCWASHSRREFRGFRDPDFAGPQRWSAGISGWRSDGPERIWMPFFAAADTVRRQVDQGRGRELGLEAHRQAGCPVVTKDELKAFAKLARRKERPDIGTSRTLPPERRPARRGSEAKGARPTPALGPKEPT